MSDSPDPGSQPLLASRYRLLQSLVKGGFGDTYLAQDEQLPSRRQVLVKRLRPIQNNDQTRATVEAAFLREAKVLEDVGRGHVQIPELFAYFQEDGAFWLVQEYIPGSTLASLGQIDGATALQLLLDLLPVLVHLHERGLLHRDIKPANIILRTGDHLPVLIDYGAVREAMGATRLPSGLLVSTVVIGTQGYMPPEQAAGRPIFSSDLYALALTLITLLSGHHPQELPSDPATGAIRWREFTPDLLPELATVLERATEVMPALRFPTAREMLEAVAAISGATIWTVDPVMAAAGTETQTQATRVVAPGHPTRPPAQSESSEPADSWEGEAETDCGATGSRLASAAGLVLLAALAGTGLAWLLSRGTLLCRLQGTCETLQLAEPHPAPMPVDRALLPNTRQLVRDLAQPQDLDSLRRNLKTLEQLLPRIVAQPAASEPGLTSEQLTPVLETARQRLQAELQDSQMIDRASRLIQTGLEAANVRENRQELQQLRKQLQAVQPDGFVYEKARQLLRKLPQLREETVERSPSPVTSNRANTVSTASEAPQIRPAAAPPVTGPRRRSEPATSSSPNQSPLWDATNPQSGNQSNLLW